MVQSILYRESSQNWRFLIQILGNETLIIAGYEAIKVSIFHWLAVLKEDDDLQK